MNKLKKGKWEILLALALLASIAVGAALQEKVDWREHLIRLHVVANSDSEADQAQKLQVRDAVLEAVEPILAGVNDAEEACVRLEANLALLETAADQALKGTGLSAGVTLQREVFPLREYETFSLPAGEYQALRVTIGDGAGKNWWCVVYPSLCMAATSEEVTELAIAAGFSEEEAALLTGQQDGYVFRFRILELWDQLVAWLRSL